MIQKLINKLILHNMSNNNNNCNRLNNQMIKITLRKNYYRI